MYSEFKSTGDRKMVKGSLYELAEFYDKFKKEGEGRFQFLERKKEEGAFTRSVAQINRDYVANTGKVFKSNDVEMFLKGE